MIPPGRSPMRGQQPPRRDESAAEASSTIDVEKLMDALCLQATNGGADEVEQVASDFLSKVNLDDDLRNDLISTFTKWRLKSSRNLEVEESSSQETSDVSPGGSAKENEPRTQSSSGAAPSATANFETAYSPLNDSTPTASNATPMTYVRKTSTASESARMRVRSPSPSPARSRSRSRSAVRSRNGTPTRPLFGRRTRTPDSTSYTKVENRTPSRSRSPRSPFRRFFGGSKSDAALNPPPAEQRGPVPTSGTVNSSGLPRTPLRQRSEQSGATEPIVMDTPAARTVDSMPTPPSTAGNTFLSPNASEIPWDEPTPETPKFQDAVDDPNGCKTGVGKVRRKLPTPPLAGLNVGASLPTTQPVQVEMPSFRVNLRKTQSERTIRPTTRRNLRRPKQAGGPEHSFPQAQPARPTQFSVEQNPRVAQPSFAAEEADIHQTLSADSVLHTVNGQSATAPSMYSPSVNDEQTKQPGNDSSPDFMDISSEEKTDSPEIRSPVAGIQFAIGSSDKKPHSGGRRPRRNPRRLSSGKRGHRTSQRTTTGIFPRTSPTKAANPYTMKTFSADIRMNASGESADSSGDQTLRTASTCSSEVDYTGRNALVLSLREEARTFYTTHDFYSAAMSYTKALRIHVGDPSVNPEVDDLRAVLLANRAASLLMLEAYGAAAADCQEALTFVSDQTIGTGKLASDSGLMLKAKLLARMGKALLKLGKLQEAEQAFCNAVNAANAELNLARQLDSTVSLEQNKRYLSQLIMDAESGRIEVGRCKEAAEGLRSSGCVSPSSVTAASRRSHMQALIYVNKALEFAPGSISFHEKKVALLAALKRWREIAGHCERFAAKVVKFDGLFEGDLAAMNPFPGVPPARYLESTAFDVSDPAESSTKKLNTKAAGEAALRLPYGLLPFYLRALRLEERYQQAMSAVESLTNLVEATEGTSNINTMRMQFAWLSKEQDKLTRTASTKERGDTLFRGGDFQLAAAQYTSCLTIDAEGLRDGECSEVSNAGGRLHAILHCNRAACLMAVKKFHEAVTDCTSALRIHSHYMKAMLRRSRCYARLERYEEATVEYQRWLELVEKAQKSTLDLDAMTAPCLFDSPKDIPGSDVAKVRQELLEAMRSKRIAENAARSDATYREDRRRWYEETFGRADQSDAQQRREQWHSQKSASARRWDSFAGRSPKRESKRPTTPPPRRGQYERQQQHQDRSSNNRQNAAQGSPGSDASLDHYAVLGVARNATDAQIKKAYRKVSSPADMCNRFAGIDSMCFSHPFFPGLTFIDGTEVPPGQEQRPGSCAQVSQSQASVRDSQRSCSQEHV